MRVASFLAALIPAAVLPAQTGSHTTFGAGCSGTGFSICWKNNARGGSLLPLFSIGTWPQYAIELKTANSAAVLSGFWLYTKKRSFQSGQAAAFIYLAGTNGLPRAKPAATGSIKVGTALGWYKAVFPKPFIVTANTTFFLSWDIANPFKPPFDYPLVRGGVTWKAYGRNGSSVWRLQTPALPWAFQVECAGGTPQLPVLSYTNPPSIGQSYTIDLKGVRAPGSAVLLFGASNAKWGAFTLPLNLGFLGAAKCALLVSPDLLAPVPISAPGGVSFPVRLPPDRTLLGKRLHNQWMVLDLGANRLGWIFSNGGTSTIGT